MELEKDYIKFIAEIKNEISKTKLKVVSKINNSLIEFYFFLGKRLVEKQEKSKWGEKVLETISNDLKTEGFKGFSISNLKFMRRFYLSYREDKIGQQLVTQIPWGHNILIFDKIKETSIKHWYLQKIVENGWSRKVLELQISSNLYSRSKKVLIENFKSNLPPKQSDLAREIFKDEYVLDFIDLKEDFKERDLERELVSNVKKFLLELGPQFSFLGNQFKLNLNGEDFFVDLLFFNRDLNCLVAIELKIGSFKPEYTGKMNFYLNLLKSKIKNDHENDPIGIILCKKKDKVVAQLSLDGIKTPIAISEFTHKLEKELNKNIERLNIK